VASLNQKGSSSFHADGGVRDVVFLVLKKQFISNLRINEKGDWGGLEEGGILL